MLAPPGVPSTPLREAVLPGNTASFREQDGQPEHAHPGTRRFSPRLHIMSEPSSPRTIDEYIEASPPHVRSILKRIRSTIRKVVPEAEERISYRMPAFFLVSGHPAER